MQIGNSKGQFRRRDLNEKSICNMYPKESITKLAKSFNCSANTIFKILKRNMELK